MQQNSDLHVNLDFLRAYAVLLVSGGHLWHFFGNHFLFGKLEMSGLGILGVMMFFVHTSLVLMFSMERMQRENGGLLPIRSFFIRRFLRIYPLSIFMVIITQIFALPLAELSNYQVHSFDLSWDRFIAHLFLLQNFFKGYSSPGVLWSLTYEVQMYLVLPFLYLLARKSGKTSSLLGL